MIRSSALLTAAAMAMLVAGVFSASLGLIYASIAVSILAAATLGVGVLLRRRELFGQRAAADTRPGRAAPDIADGRPAGSRPAGIGAAVTKPASAVQGGPQVDDLARPRRDRHAAVPGSGDLPSVGDADGGAETGAAAARDAGGAWSAWTSVRTSRAKERAAGGRRDPDDQGERRGGDELRDEGERRAAAAQDARPPGAAAAGAGTGAPAEAQVHSEAKTRGEAKAGGEPKPDGEATADGEAKDREVGTAATAGSAMAEAAAEGDRALAGDAAEGDGGTAEAKAEESALGERDQAVAGAKAEASAEGDAAAEDSGEPDDDGARAGDIGRPDGVTVAPADGSASAGPGATVGSAADGDAVALAADVTIVPGVARYHRRGCILIRFLTDSDLETMTRREAEAVGSVPCKACQPDKPGPST